MRLGPRRHPPDPLVVGIEDSDAVGRERLDELALRLLDSLDRPDPRQVNRLDRGDDADLRPPDPGQVGDLAADVHAHLEDGRLVVRPEPHDRQRQADLVVLVALVLEGHEIAREDRRDRLLRRGLGDAARSPRRRADRTGLARPRRSRGTPRSVSGTWMTDTPAAARSMPSGVTRDQDRRRTARRQPRRRRHGRPSARRAGRRTGCPGRPRGSRRRRPARSATERARTRPPVAPARSSVVSPEAAAPSVDGACDAGSVTDSSVAYEIVTEPAVSGAGGVRRSGSSPGRVIASVAMRRNSSNDMTGISSWPIRAIVGRALVDLH